MNRKVAAGLASVMLALAACASSDEKPEAKSTVASSTTSPAATGSASASGAPATATEAPAAGSGAALTVLVDDTRREPAEAWAKSHPSPAIKIEVADNSQGAIPSKIALAKKSGGKLPDVIFLSQPDELSTLAANPVNYPLDLTKAVDAATLGSFAKGSVDRCTFEGKVYCLPNDIAQTVLFYNKTLFDKWGYAVPTTFEAWRELGARTVKEHPGYSLGTVSGRYGVDAYYGSSGCPLNSSSSPVEVKINVADPACTRVNEVVGPMMADGSLSTLDPFDTNYVKTVKDGKLLAAIAPSWFGAYGIKPNYTTEGDFAAAAMPRWAGAEDSYSGAVGGGLWIVSATSENVKGAADFIVAMTTDEATLVAAPTYPAHTAGAAAWLKSTSSDKWYAQDPAPAFVEQAGKINPALGYVRYQTQLLDAYSSIVVASKGKNLDGALKTFGERISQAAQAAGYQVSK